MYNKQEYYSPAGTGKSTLMIPFQMFLNRRKFNEFFIIGREGEGDYHKYYHEFCRNYLGFKYYWSKYKNTGIRVFSLKPFITQFDGNKLREEINLFLSEASLKSNIILDELPIILAQAPEVLDDLENRAHKVGMISWFGQDSSAIDRYRNKK